MMPIGGASPAALTPSDTPLTRKERLGLALAALAAVASAQHVTPRSAVLYSSLTPKCAPPRRPPPKDPTPTPLLL